MDRTELDLSVLDTGTAGYFDFLNEEEFRGLEGAASGADGTDGGANSGGMKRDRDTDECQSEEGPEVSGSGKASRVGVEGKSCKSKACREKARRERINERFQELAKLCDPDDPKTDKASILAESIKIITQLKVEKGQLRQLNKFLEERVSNFEKEKGQSLYQQSMMLQGRFQPAMQAMVQQTAVQCPQAGFQVALGTPVPGMVGGPLPMPSVWGPVDGTAPTSTQQSVGPVVGTPVPSGLPPSMPPSATPTPAGSQSFGGPTSWLPFMDTTQDHLLRPPAA